MASRSQKPSTDGASPKSGKKVSNVWYLIRETAQRYIGNNRTSSPLDLHQDFSNKNSNKAGNINVKTKNFELRTSNQGASTKRKATETREKHGDTCKKDKPALLKERECKKAEREDDCRKKPSREKVLDGKRQGEKNQNNGSSVLKAGEVSPKVSSEPKVGGDVSSSHQHKQGVSRKSSSFNGVSSDVGDAENLTSVEFGGAIGDENCPEEDEIIDIKKISSRSSSSDSVPSVESEEYIVLSPKQQNNFESCQTRTQDCYQSIPNSSKDTGIVDKSGEGNFKKDNVAFREGIAIKEGVSYVKQPEGFASQDEMPLIWETHSDVDDVTDREKAVLLASTLRYASDYSDDDDSDDGNPIFRSKTYTVLGLNDDVADGGPSTGEPEDDSTLAEANRSCYQFENPLSPKLCQSEVIELGKSSGERLCQSETDLPRKLTDLQRDSTEVEPDAAPEPESSDEDDSSLDLSRKGTFTVMGKTEYFNTKLLRKGTFVVMNRKAVREEDARYRDLMRKGTFVVLGKTQRESQRRREEEEEDGEW